MKSILTIILATFLLVSCNTEKKAGTQSNVKWLTIAEVQEKMKTSPRKVLIDIYAEWCGPCKRMSKYTFTDPAVVKYINEKYYAVKFDAESKEDVRFLNKMYKNKARTHDFAIQVGSTNRGLSYPTIVYFDEDFNKLQAVPGYYPAQEYIKIIQYFGGNHHKSMTYEQYYESH